jgi:hypothetical protein
MARRSLPATDLPLRLTDVDIVAEAGDDGAAARIDGAVVAALLDVAADTDRLLDPEDISLELEHVADLLGVLAEGARPRTAGALSLAEHCLKRLAARVDALRPGARSQARRWVITTSVREAPRDYTARWTLALPGSDAERAPMGASPQGVPVPASIRARAAAIAGCTEWSRTLCRTTPSGRTR